MRDAPTVHISRGVNVRYLAMTKTRGHRKWRPLGEWTRSKRKACRTLIDAMARQSHIGRGMVVHMADYYDPMPFLEVRRP